MVTIGVERSDEDLSSPGYQPESLTTSQTFPLSRQTFCLLYCAERMLRQDDEVHSAATSCLAIWNRALALFALRLPPLFGFPGFGSDYPSPLRPVSDQFLSESGHWVSALANPPACLDSDSGCLQLLPRARLEILLREVRSA